MAGRIPRGLARALAAVAVIGAGLAVGATGAGASPPENQTVTEKGTDTFVDVVPMCDGAGPLYEITINFNYVEHATESENNNHFTFTQTGSFVAEALEADEPDAAGRFTIWGGFNENPGGAVNGTFTFSVRGAFEDGKKINFHFTEHFNETPRGGSFFFAKCRD